MQSMQQYSERQKHHTLESTDDEDCALWCDVYPFFSPPPTYPPPSFFPYSFVKEEHKIATRWAFKMILFCEEDGLIGQIEVTLFFVDCWKLDWTRKLKKYVITSYIPIYITPKNY